MRTEDTFEVIDRLRFVLDIIDDFQELVSWEQAVPLLAQIKIILVEHCPFEASLYAHFQD